MNAAQWMIFRQKTIDLAQVFNVSSAVIKEKIGPS